ncbi:MAG: hypothetical protein UU71_C0006G0008 [Parcubacteria group bacterium GW2011_GWB1_41_6]|nr:MAG: hypothetical protein UU71_C0006G0008 [Parcubacteria group bacterium GW2011_GWB1_41_6]KKS34134.1 MAG: hypothetical protein UU96_C0008G0013 [Parcubacteria group bacterium GW2011_GWC2_42_13]KKS57764.1 MAG: hypothetical protein UV22_C0013G0004 [Parcubacteria group bacterium GW2011_GWA2_42_35]
MVKVIIVFVFLLAAILIFGLWTVPLVGKIKDLRNQKSEVENVLVNSRQIRNLRDDLIGKYNNIASLDLERLKKLLPTKTNDGGLIVQFDNLTRSRGLILKSLAVTEKESPQNKAPAFALSETSPKEKQETGYQEAELNFKVAGSYENLLAFLGDLEKSLRMIDIDSIVFSAGNKDIYEFNIKARTYVLAPAEKSGVEATDLLTIFGLLRKTEIDELFFQNSVLSSLQDFSSELKIAEIQTGRPNPFSPI